MRRVVVNPTLIQHLRYVDAFFEPKLRISFRSQLKATFVNPGPNYLSAGDASVPTVYLLLSLCFLAALVIWISRLRASPTQVQPIHRIMTVLLVFKFSSLFAEAMRYHYMKTRGDSLTSWTVVFYIFAFIKVSSSRMHGRRWTCTFTVPDSKRGLCEFWNRSVHFSCLIKKL